MFQTLSLKLLQMKLFASLILIIYCNLLSSLEGFKYKRVHGTVYERFTPHICQNREPAVVYFFIFFKLAYLFLQKTRKGLEEKLIQRI